MGQVRTLSVRASNAARDAGCRGDRRDRLVLRPQGRHQRGVPRLRPMSRRRTTFSAPPRVRTRSLSSCVTSSVSSVRGAPSGCLPGGGAWPDVTVACVGGGLNAIGSFTRLSTTRALSYNMRLRVTSMDTSHAAHHCRPGLSLTCTHLVLQGATGFALRFHTSDSPA